MSSQIKLLDGIAKNIVLPKLQSASSQDKVRSCSRSPRSARTKTHSTELLKLPKNRDFHARSSSRGVEKSIIISDESVSTTVASTHGVSSNSRCQSAANLSKALSMEEDKSSYDGRTDVLAREEEKKVSVQNFLTLDRIANEKKVPLERCYSQAAKLTMNNDRESDIGIRVACLKADRSLSRMDSAKEKLSMTIEAYREWERSFNLTCRRVALREASVSASAEPCKLKLPPLSKPAAINMQDQ